MSVSPCRYRPIAIALVVQDDDGTMHIIGSKAIKSFEIEMSQGGVRDFLSTDRVIRPLRNFHFEADCNDILWQVTTPAPLPPQIERRGIYLPDMSFRALPSPEET